jgi:hypothetical protein
MSSSFAPRPSSSSASWRRTTPRRTSSRISARGFPYAQRGTGGRGTSAMSGPSEARSRSRRSALLEQAALSVIHSAAPSCVTPSGPASRFCRGLSWVVGVRTRRDSRCLSCSRSAARVRLSTHPALSAAALRGDAADSAPFRRNPHSRRGRGRRRGPQCAFRRRRALWTNRRVLRAVQADTRARNPSRRHPSEGA